jgi:uncharacterized membrane protein
VTTLGRAAGPSISIIYWPDPINGLDRWPCLRHALALSRQRCRDAEEKTMRTIRRDLLKTLSFAVLHFGVAFSVAYALTGSVAIATGIGLIEPVANTVAFYFHERAWRRVDGHGSAVNNAPVACCGVLGAK